MLRYSREFAGVILLCLWVNQGFSQPPPERTLNGVQEEIAQIRRELSSLLARLETVEQQLSASRTGIAATSEPNARQDASSSAPTAGTADASVPLALDGFCSVTLDTTERWSRGRPEFSAEHNGKLYLFADEESLRRFQADPARYTPAMNGRDVVVAKRESRLVDGQRCYGMRYRGRAFFFRSEETLREFSNDPSSFSAFANAQQEKASKSRPQDACPEAGAVKSPPPPSRGGEEDKGQSLHRSSEENSQEIQAQG